MNESDFLTILTIAYPFLAYGVGSVLCKLGWVTTFVRVIYLAITLYIFVEITYPFNPLDKGPQEIVSERLSHYPLYMQVIAFVSTLVLVGLWCRIDNRMIKIGEKKLGKY